MKGDFLSPCIAIREILVLLLPLIKEWAGSMALGLLACGAAALGLFLLNRMCKQQNQSRAETRQVLMSLAQDDPSVQIWLSLN